MAEDFQRKPLSESFIQRVAQGLNYVFTGKKNDNWFGPGEPLSPVAPPGTPVRLWDFRTSQNVNITPRDEEPITYSQLRTLADNYDLLRLVIETRKDQIAKLKWSVNLRELSPGQPSKDDRCQDIEAFFRYPDKENSWNIWVRMLLEEMFVIDAASIYARKTVGGKLYALDIIDGSTIKRVIDDTGRTPLTGPAYQQILKGLPAIDLEREDLIYTPRNKRAHKLVGFSPVEQILVTVNIALRRQLHQLQYYSEGNIPEAFVGVPADWTPTQIGEFQQYWDSIFEGNTANRRKAKFIPGGTGGLQIQQTRETVLKDMYDEWLARLIAYAFSVSPLPLVREQNRSSSETLSEQAADEGLVPVMAWVKDIIDLAIQRYWGYSDLEFRWENSNTTDPATRASVNIQYVKAGIISIDKAREDLGLDPLGMPEAIFGMGPLGLTFVADLADPDRRAALLQQAQPQLASGAQTVDENGNPVPQDQDGSNQAQQVDQNAAPSQIEQPFDVESIITSPDLSPQMRNVLGALGGNDVSDE